MAHDEEPQQADLETPGAGENSPAETNPPPAFARLWKRFVEYEYHELLTLIFGLIALIGATVSIVLSVQQDRSHASTEATRSAFEVAVHATTASQAEEQIRIQQTQAAVEQGQRELVLTQTALDEEMNEIMRRQARPYMKLIHPSPAVVLSDVKARTDAERGSLIEGSGTIDLLLANDGGARAALVGVHWKKPTSSDSIVDLQVIKDVTTSIGVAVFPVNIEGPSASSLGLRLSGTVADRDNTQVQTTYQLGRSWASIIEPAGTYLEFEFSNAEPITLGINRIDLDLPTTVIIPSPPSPFTVTDADTLGQVRVEIRLTSPLTEELPLQGYVYDVANMRESPVILSQRDTSLTFPVGEYSLKLRMQDSSDQVTHFSVQHDSVTALRIELQPTPTPVLVEYLHRIPTSTKMIALVVLLLGMAGTTLAYLEHETGRLAVHVHSEENTLYRGMLVFSRLRRSQRVEVKSIGTLLVTHKADEYEITVDGDLLYLDRLRHKVTISWKEDLCIELSDPSCKGPP